jgi:hypothetical protein
MTRVGIKIVDPFAKKRAADSDRIAKLLEGIGLFVTIDQRSRLVELIGKLPMTDEELVCRLMLYVRVDYFPNFSAQSMKMMADGSRELLEAAHCEYVESSRDTSRRMNAERIARFVTAGLERHPDWWSDAVPCACLFCVAHSL